MLMPVHAVSLVAIGLWLLDNPDRHILTAVTRGRDAMRDPARTWNAVVVGEDTPCWSETRRHERLKARCCCVR